MSLQTKSYCEMAIRMSSHYLFKIPHTAIAVSDLKAYILGEAKLAGSVWKYNLTGAPESRVSGFVGKECLV